MTEFASPREELLASLKRYTTGLRQRRNILAQLSQTSSEMCSALQHDPASDIEVFLRERDAQTNRYAALSGGPSVDETFIHIARRAAEAAGGELSALGNLALSLHSEAQSLAEEILARQAECEAIIKERIQSVTQELRESKQRRKLDAAYGPACRHGSPVFLDKQQ